MNTFTYIRLCTIALLTFSAIANAEESDCYSPNTSDTYAIDTGIFVEDDSLQQCSCKDDQFAVDITVRY